MKKLAKLTLQGFKSIRHLPDLSFGRLNVLIGANGAGKSNLISFFKMLNWMTPAPGGLQLHVSKTGGANALLYQSAAVTPQLQAALAFETDAGANEYHLRLIHAAQDTLIFADEQIRFSRGSYPTAASWRSLGAGHRETQLTEFSKGSDKLAQTARMVLGLLKACVVYQFHNTSDTARIRQRWDVEDNYFLKEDAANLAPFLLKLRKGHSLAYSRIVETIRQIAPFFADFVLEPTQGRVILQWRETTSDLVFGAHQASDGMLRSMALIALLLQPEEQLPSVVILDEPELGLHPYAINIVAGLLQSISHHTQVILATQSMTLIDRFAPEQIIVVDRTLGESLFKRLDAAALKDWLEEYSVAELWEKNVIGGKPAK
ncbi:MAG: AAA family ATPase [Acidobacteria bacterium]|nr:AAA family ATPase [Acidobacteriota bacterium]